MRRFPLQCNVRLALTNFDYKQSCPPGTVDPVDQDQLEKLERKLACHIDEDDHFLCCKLPRLVPQEAECSESMAVACNQWRPREVADMRIASHNQIVTKPARQKAGCIKYNLARQQKRATFVTFDHEAGWVMSQFECI